VPFFYRSYDNLSVIKDYLSVLFNDAVDSHILTWLAEQKSKEFFNFLNLYFCDGVSNVTISFVFFLSDLLL